MAYYPSEHGALHGHIGIECFQTINCSSCFIKCLEFPTTTLTTLKRLSITYLMLLQTSDRSKHDFIISSFQSKGYLQLFLELDWSGNKHVLLQLSCPRRQDTSIPSFIQLDNSKYAQQKALCRTITTSCLLQQSRAQSSTSFGTDCTGPDMCMF
eukprot:1137406-Pelagomonas_calceolata.AAC.1